MIDSVSLGTSSRIGSNAVSTHVDTDMSSNVDFASILKDMAHDASDQLRAGEAAAISGLRGQLPVQDVVEAMMSAERALQTALAIRDKTISAWQEISRMSI